MTEGGEVAACEQLPGGSEEDVLWAWRMSDMLGMSDGATDNPTGSSWSMGIAMSVWFCVEWQVELCSNFSQ